MNPVACADVLLSYVAPVTIILALLSVVDPSGNCPFATVTISTDLPEQHAFVGCPIGGVGPGRQRKVGGCANKYSIECLKPPEKTISSGPASAPSAASAPAQTYRRIDRRAKYQVLGDEPLSLRRHAT
jgi:hypothetical protein